MDVITVTALRRNIDQTIELVNEGHMPITIINDRGSNAVLVGEDDWAAIKETLYLASIPGMAKNLQSGLAEPIENCLEENCAWR